MTNKPVTYPLPEGTFLTLPPDADYSVNILKYTDDESRPYEVIINRAQLADGQTVEDFYEMQQQRMRQFTPGYTPEGEILSQELGPSKLPVLQAANRFLNNGEWTKQILSVIRLPYESSLNPSHNNLLIFTLATAGEFTDSQRKHYVRIMNSFTAAETPLSTSGTVE